MQWSKSGVTYSHGWICHQCGALEADLPDVENRAAAHTVATGHDVTVTRSTSFDIRGHAETIAEAGR